MKKATHRLIRQADRPHVWVGSPLWKDQGAESISRLLKNLVWSDSPERTG